jgi:hypothetical protein
VIEMLESRRLLSMAAPVGYTVGATPVAVATGDLNGDGRSDVVTANPGGNDVSVLLSNADGALQAAQQFPTGTGPSSVAVGDVNNDGKRDIVTANGGGNLSVLLGNGNGTFQAALTVALPDQTPPGYTGTPLTQYPTSVAVGDLNADGKLDLAVNGRTTFYVPYYSPYGGKSYWPQTNGYVNVLIGSGNGTFANANAYLANSVSNSVGMADMNNDTKLDVVTGAYDPAVWLGNGNGTLQEPPARFSPSYPTFAIGDFDMDGMRDLVTGGALNFLKGVGNGTFQSPVAIPVVGEPRSVVAGDLNGDGKLDIVASTTKTTFASYGYYGGYDPTTTVSTKVLLGSGNGTFARGISSTVTSYPDYAISHASALGDFNGDGRPDLVTTDSRNAKVFVQLNEPGWIVPGALSISNADAVTEGHTGTVNAVFTVTLAEAPGANVSVNYSVLDGTATLAGGDFAATAGTLTFLPGQTSKTITVPVTGDRISEYDEYFIVRLTDSTNADIVNRDGVGTIMDDEPRIVSFTGETMTEGNSGTLPMTFTVGLSAPSDVPVTVDYTTIDYYATGATDFVPVTATLTFSPGQTTRTFTVQVRGDLVAEYQEDVLVNLSSPTPALFDVTPQARGTIIDTDPDPTISIANVSRSEGNSGQTVFELVVYLSNLSEKDIWVRYSTANGSASSSGGNKDYISEVNNVSIYPRHMYGSVYVTVLGDTRNESDETFLVNLSLPNNVTIADGQGVGTILNDESRGKTWIGPATDGLWSTASNWSPSGVPGATSLVRINGASVTVSSSVTVSELTLDNYATLTVAPNGNHVLRTSGLFIDYWYSTLNLNDNDMIIDYTAAAGTISPLGGWNRWDYFGIARMVSYGSIYDGTGIVTTQPDAINGVTTLGVAEASQVLGLSGSQTALFSGQTVDATTVVIKYTYGGDANLDGQVNVADLGLLASNWQNRAPWTGGDFNYDGFIDVADLGILATNWQRSPTLGPDTQPGSLRAARTLSRLIDQLPDETASAAGRTS